jgi:hypothetical protein
MCGRRHRRSGGAFAHGDEPIVLIERQTAKHNSVDDREDRGRRADAERQHDERRDGKAPGCAKGAQRRFEVVTHVDIIAHPVRALVDAVQRASPAFMTRT